MNAATDNRGDRGGLKRLGRLDHAFAIEGLLGGGIVVRLLEPCLSVESVVRAAGCIEADAPADGASVVFDFARVRELTGAWGLHFAVLIDLARRSGIRIVATGLCGQPAGVAWVYRRCPEVRALFASGTAIGDSGAADAAVRETA